MNREPRTESPFGIPTDVDFEMFMDWQQRGMRARSSDWQGWSAL
jgi:hypothetical protein